jgi:hypothetical protein
MQDAKKLVENNVPQSAMNSLSELSPTRLNTIKYA